MSRHTVFVIENEEDLRSAIRLLLSSAGFAVETFSSAEEFLDRYNPALPGCLVLDVRLPSIWGPDLQEILLMNQFNIPIIFITGHSDMTTSERVMRAGAIDIIEKPFNDQILIDRVHQALEHVRRDN